jgi:hypothetical protein
MQLQVVWRRAARLAAGTILLFVACGERVDFPPAETPDETVPGRIGVATPARYLTTLAFAGAGATARHLYVRLSNDASESELRRDYGAWMADAEGWQRLLDLSDTLPVPRAAWRVLPSEQLRVMVGDDAELSGLLFRGNERHAQLTPSGVVAEWTGWTGQRARLGLASLDLADASDVGLLFFRRAARPASAGASDLVERIFLLADSLGNGMLIQTVPGEADPTPVAWTWIEGVENSWSDVRLSAIGLDEESDPRDAREWTIQIPNAEATGRLRVAERDSTALPSRPFQPGERFYLLSGELTVGELVLVLRGVGVESPLP